uniref:Uncharacterized protein n=1 Tax=Panagrolaimus superbus TaxID=310955 RepID=A0A914ZHZ8_9BILA
MSRNQRKLNEQYRKLTKSNQPTVETPEFPNYDEIPDHEFEPMDATDFGEGCFKNVVNFNDINYERVNTETSKPIGEPLFLNSQHSVVEFSMAIMGAARQKDLTDAAVNVFLDLFRIFLPNSNKVPSSYNKIKKIVTQNHSSPSRVKEVIKCCGVCCEKLCTCGKNETTMVVIYDLDVQFLRLFSKYKVKMQNYRAEMLAEETLMDIHQTEQYKEALRKYKNMIPLSYYSDGGRYAENGKFEGWPLIASILDLPPVLRGKFTNLIFMAYWYSPVKPNWEFIFKKMNIRPFFKFDNTNYRVTCFQVIADLPAKQHFLNMLNVNGYNSCSDCDIKGENINRTMTFPYAELIQRDPKNFLIKNKTVNGVKGLSVLKEYLEKFPQGAIIDVMHSVYKGPMEDDLKRLLNGFKFNDTGTRLIKINNDGKELLEKILSK